MPKFFFEAGSFNDLSYAELTAVFLSFNINTDSIHRFSDKIFVVSNKDFTEELGLKIFSRLGGFIRFGSVIENMDTFLDSFLEQDSKVVYGISVLDQVGDFNPDFVRKLSRNIKEGFREAGISSRFISSSKSKALNSAQVTKNKILEKGFELCLIDNGGEQMYGKTLSIQNVDEFAKRDYEKPYTDTKMGTLPPKLARMMVNLSGKREGILWDPFCGSGTILLEGAVLGFDVLGTDIDNNAIYYTQQNLLWLDKENMIGDIRYNVFPLDIKNVEKKVKRDIKKTEISTVVCEPYMGPYLKKPVSDMRADELLEEVKKLYNAFFSVIEDILRIGDTIVIVLPSYKTHNGWKTVPMNEIIGKRWEVVNPTLSGGRDLKWNRKNSIITRNIFVLRKK